MMTKFVFDSGYSFEKDLKISDRWTPHFRFSEIANRAADDKVKLVVTPANCKHMQMIEDYRHLMGDAAITVTSGYRTAAFNKSVGGDQKSEHLDGLATDIGVGSKFSDADFDRAWRTWEEICAKNHVIGQVRRYSDFIHLGSDYSRYGAKAFGIIDCR